MLVKAILFTCISTICFVGAIGKLRGAAYKNTIRIFAFTMFYVNYENINFLFISNIFVYFEY
ncbi:hypothetical protein B0O79_1441 [Flavobacteriaceae bacterium MAR_2009_75]|nr:hypothetical protein B0O79_1441 [Flavobacteriaceae bacterium MAR_2009_75]